MYTLPHKVKQTLKNHLAFRFSNLQVILSTVLFKHMRATSNLLLCYQSAADFCLALHPLPIMVTRVTSHWVLGDLLCRSYMYTFFITGCEFTIIMFLRDLFCRSYMYTFFKTGCGFMFLGDLLCRSCMYTFIKTGCGFMFLGDLLCRSYMYSFFITGCKFTI